jgi:MEDS: MEthanogen/methylotroph, DcmR Sensory domain
MDLSDDPSKHRGSAPLESDRPIRLGSSILGQRRHVCAFFRSRAEEYRVLLPFIQDGFERGEKAVHTVDPERRADHLGRLESAGIATIAARQAGQLEMRSWSDTHLREGRFDQDKTLALFQGIAEEAKQQGFPLIRFITHMEWALQNKPGVNDLLEYEAKANNAWLHQKGPVNPVICTYDLSKFGGAIIVDIMRTHPMIIIGGILQENPFFIPPDEFLRELRARSSVQNQ